MFPVMSLDLQVQSNTMPLNTATRPVTPVPFLCPQTWVPISVHPPGQRTPPSLSLCTILVGLKVAQVVVLVLASTHPYQQVAVQACHYTWTPPRWPCCSSTTTSLISEVKGHEDQRDLVQYRGKTLSNYCCSNRKTVTFCVWHVDLWQQSPVCIGPRSEGLQNGVLWYTFEIENIWHELNNIDHVF